MTFQILVGHSNHWAMGDSWRARSYTRFLYVWHVSCPLCKVQRVEMINVVLIVTKFLYFILTVILRSKSKWYWSSSKGSTCAPPTLPRGSTIIHPLKQEKYEKGSVVLFGCKPGFYLVGKPIIKCLKNAWSQRKFRCVGMIICSAFFPFVLV